MVADLICVRNHIRTFYPTAETPFTLKLPRLNDASSGNAIKHEIAARGRVEETGLLRVPKLIGNPDGNFFSEEIVSGRNPSFEEDARKLCDWIETELWPHYERQGLEYVRVSKIVDLESLPTICESVNWTAPARFLDASSEFARSDKQVISTYVHGDLTAANLLLSPDDTIWVIDWESAREDVLGTDIWVLVQEVNGARNVLASRISALPTLDLDGQLLVHVFLKIIEWSRHGMPKRPPAQCHAMIRLYLDHAVRLLPKS